MLCVVIDRLGSLDRFVSGERVVEDFLAVRIAAQGDALGEQRFCDLWEETQGSGFDQEGLGAVAGGGVGGFGVDDDAGCRFGVGGVLEEEGADAVGVAEDGDLGRRLDEADELVGAARDDQVDVLVQGEELGDYITCFDELDGVVGDGGRGEGGGDYGGDGYEGLGGFLASCSTG